MSQRRIRDNSAEATLSFWIEAKWSEAGIWGRSSGREQGSQKSAVDPRQNQSLCGRGRLQPGKLEITGTKKIYSNRFLTALLVQSVKPQIPKKNHFISCIVHKLHVGT